MALEALKSSYAMPSDDVIWGAGLSMTNEDSDFPVAFIKDSDPATLAKSTTNTTTITITTSSITPVAVFLFQTNADTATFNGNAITIPAIDTDGLRTHPWLNLTGLVGAGTSWSLVLSRTSGAVFIGRVSLVTTFRDLNWKYGLQRGRLRPGRVKIVTRLGSFIKHDSELRQRWFKGLVDLAADRATLNTLEKSAKGIMLPFPLVPDVDTNDAYFVSFAEDDWSETLSNYDVHDIPLHFIEECCGPVDG